MQQAAAGRANRGRTKERKALRTPERASAMYWARQFLRSCVDEARRTLND